MAGICIAVLKGHRDFVRSLAVDATRIVSGDFGGYIRVSMISPGYSFALEIQLN
jgi:hypothetical protein